MSITNAIANFGLQTGQNTQRTVMNALAQRENRKRYEDRRNMLVQDREDKALRRQAKQEELNQKAEEAREMEFSKGWVNAYYSAPDEATKQRVYQGGAAKAIENGYLSPEQVKDMSSDEFMGRIAGQFGHEFASNTSNLPTNIQEFKYITDIVNNPDKYPRDTVASARIKAGLDPRAVGSGAITTATTPGLTPQVAQSEGVISGAKSGASESAKLRQKMIYEPMLNERVKMAEIKANERGEVLNDVSRMKAAMPGLTATIGQLKSLAPIATHTLGGRAFDTAAHELGFGATKGSVAREKYISIINNQVLPLLRPTFGSAFTVAEGESLKATMGDPNMSPEGKVAVLESFIANKQREIETKSRQLGRSVSGQPDPLGLGL